MEKVTLSETTPHRGAVRGFSKDLSDQNDKSTARPVQDGSPDSLASFGSFLWNQNKIFKKFFVFALSDRAGKCLA